MMLGLPSECSDVDRPQQMRIFVGPCGLLWQLILQLVLRARQLICHRLVIKVLS